MSTVKVNTISTWTGSDVGIETGKTISGTASQFKMTDVVQGDVLYGSAADTLSRLAPGTAGQVLQTQGAGANPVWAADAGGLWSSYAVIVDSKATATGGGGFTSGAWRTRDLNLEIADPDGIVSISSNEFTLAAGSYLINWSCPHHQVTNCETRLYDVTGTAHVQSGASGYSATGASTQGRDGGSARITPSGSNAYTIEHRCDVTNATNGFGVSIAYGETIIFTIVEIFKEA